MQIPPHNKDIELATLSVMVNNPEVITPIIEVDDFYNPTYRVIVKWILGLKEAGTNIDLVTIYDAVKEKIPKIEELTTIASDVSSSIAWFPTYIETLKEFRRKREQVRIANELVQLSDGSPWMINQFADKLKEIAKIGATQDDTVKFDDVNNAYELIMERMGKKLYGYSWGKQFEFLDNATKWLLKKQIYRIGAPSWVGKTQMIYTMVPELLAQTNPDGTPVKVAFFTLENTKESTLTAIMCKAQWINQFKLTQWEVEGNWDYLVKLKDRLYIIDNLYELDDIFTKISQIKPDIVLLDYIWYVRIKGFTDADAYTEYAKRVVRYAKENSVCWIDLSNLANDTQTNDEILVKPKFYWSSFLVNNSDINVMLMRNQVYSDARNYVYRNKSMFKPDDIYYFSSRDIVDMVVTKNRWGPVRQVTTYGVNQDNWWNHRELPQSDLDALKIKYGW